MTLQDLIVGMLKCEQTNGQTVYQHGISVWHHFLELQNNPNDNWKLPSWFLQYKKQLLANLHDAKVISTYLTLHDCGKPFCRVEEDGKVHFPNHAEISKKVFLESGGDPIVANLIGWDMEIHTASSEEIACLCETWTKKDACTLLLAALAEIHSNAKQFGGIESLSFKTKWKNIDRRGKQICKHYFGAYNDKD